MPAMDVLPPVLVTIELAATVEPKVLMPVELMVRRPRAPFKPLPIAPVTATFPVPLEIVNADEPTPDPNEKLPGQLPHSDEVIPF